MPDEINCVPSWTTNPSVILELLDKDDVDGFLAKKHNLQHYSDAEIADGLMLVLKTEWFKTIYSVVYPSPKGNWIIKYSGVPNSTYDVLSGLVSLSSNPDYFEVSPLEEGPRGTRQEDAAANVLRRIVSKLEMEQRQITFAKFISVFGDVEIISAALQHGWRTMSGTLDGRRFIIDFGKVRPDSFAKVTLHPAGILKPARHNEIFHIGVSEEQNAMGFEELAILLMGEALRLEKQQSKLLEKESNLD